MEEERPTPEHILAKIKEEEDRLQRGRLKIFLGAAAGVGKTYTMLQAAQKLVADRVDVVAGVVVTHGRKETEALLAGLELIPERIIEYRGAKLQELDLDEVLERRPAVVLVDELAHTNAPGCRHEKRWQDVEELLQAGMDVHATMNIQHLESVNDVVEQITGIKVRETVPDSLLEKAYEIELVDLPPDDLIQRLNEGKVYLPEQSKTALNNFFKKGNLIALRELALRTTAARVDAQMLKYRRDESVKDVWPIVDRLLVCVGPSPLSARLVRSAKRMASSLRADWVAMYVETPASAKLSKQDKDRIVRTLQMAEKLGGEAVRISGTNPADDLVKYAQRRNVSKIVIGKPARPRWRELLFGSVVDDLIRRSGHIDVYVISGESAPVETAQSAYIHPPTSWRSYWDSIGILTIASVVAKLMFHHFTAVNLVMIFMLAIVLIAVRYGKGPSILSSFLAVAVFDFFFVQPYFSFAVSDTQYLLTFAVMLTVALTLSTLTSTVKLQAELARLRERQAAALFAMTREQATALSTEAVVEISQRHIEEVFDTRVAVLLGDSPSSLKIVDKVSPTFELDSKEFGVAQWVCLNRQPAGATTGTLSGSRGLYIPLAGSKGMIGVIGLLPTTIERFGNPDEKHLLETFVNQMALAVERAQLSLLSQRTEVEPGDSASEISGDRN